MKVILAGMNIDNEVLNQIKKGLKDEELSPSLTLSEDILTPESISAAYARISRSPLPVDQLRANALREIEKSRRSNENIIFEMGHASVAEHSVFNFDLIGISRLASEFLQKHRLVSFTEKSQRYIKLEEDFIIPDELKDDSQLVEEYLELIKEENSLYNLYYQKLTAYFEKKYPDMDKKLILGMAKEDARYILSLATTTQMGMTINARNLEYMIKSLLSVDNFELQTIGKKLYYLVKDVAPSLIKYYEPSEYDFKNWKNSLNYKFKCENIEKNEFDSVKLIDNTEKGEEMILSALLFDSMCYDYDTILKNIDKIDTDDLLKKVWHGIDFYDSMDRAFEMADATFEFVISSSCFAQMKRHRMATIISGNYDTNLGVTLPHSISEIGEDGSFRKMVEKVNEFHQKVKIFDKIAANYLLLNAHRKRVLMKANMREWYHFVRLRSDAHAQWEIRFVSDKVKEILKQKYPHITKILAGKDEFINKKMGKR